MACYVAAGGLVAALEERTAWLCTPLKSVWEHNLGVTCDPIGGLVQIPSIERNTMGSAKAINAARMAMSETGEQGVVR